ncbi:MAG: hypothetical protein DRQ55_08330 [Planctomycetota bacterium]|nr:MAG: hypothetical protein DRQ55_08330 [Planctomycetota bacterium]
MTLPLLRVATLLMLAAALAPVAGQQTTDAEKDLRADFKKAMISKDAGNRAAAVSVYDAATRELPEELGAIRLVARTLASALDDDSPDVSAAAVAALSWGRDPETVIEELGGALKTWRKTLEKTATRRDSESRDQYRGTLQAYAAACAALGNYKDDRAVKALEDQLKKLRPAGVLENIAGGLLTPLAGGLLALGSERAVESVVKACATFPAATFGGTSDRERSRLGMSNALHRTLEQFSLGLEIPPPEFSQNYQQDWSKWLKANKDRFEEKLGKLETPPGPPSMGMSADRRPSAKPERP